METAKPIEASQKFKFERDFAVWARKASPFLTPTTVVFAILRDYTFIRTPLNTVIDHLRSVKLLHLALSASHMPNKNFFCIHFETETAASDFINQSSFINQNRVKFVTGHEETRQVKIWIENFPPHLIQDLLPDVLKHVGTVINVSPQTIPTGKEKFLMIGRTSIEFFFNDNKTLKDLPYHIQLLGQKVFLYVAGRPRICFRCSSKLHMVAECPLRYCRVCHGLKSMGHACVKTYADHVAGPVADWEERNARFLEDQLLIDLDTTDRQLPIQSTINLNHDALLQTPIQITNPDLNNEIEVPALCDITGDSLSQMDGDKTASNPTPEINKQQPAIKQAESHRNEADHTSLSAGLQNLQPLRVPEFHGSSPRGQTQSPSVSTAITTKRSPPKPEPVSENTRSRFKKQKETIPKRMIVPTSLLKDFITGDKPKLQPLKINKKTRKLQAAKWGDQVGDDIDDGSVSDMIVGVPEPTLLPSAGNSLP